MSTQNPIFILLISKFSPACNSHLPTITTIVQNGFPLHILDIDNPQTRSEILSFGIKTVPTIALKNGEHVEYFTGEKVKDILNFMKTKVMEKTNGIQGATMLESISNDILLEEKEETVSQIDTSKLKQISNKVTKKKANALRTEREEVKIDYNEL
jgi:thioredoxin-like negative regulator of GroEL